MKKYKDHDIAIREPKLKYQHWGLNPGSANFSCEKTALPLQCKSSMDQRYVNKWAWLCSNTILFLDTKI